MSSNILGLDPGYDRLGWAVAQAGNPLVVLAYGCIQTKKNDDIMERYRQIQLELAVVLGTYQPQVAAIESIFFSKNQTTAMRVAEVRGVIIAQLLQQQIRIHEYNPMQVKLTAAGNGKADKQAIAKMVGLQVKWPAGQLPSKTTLDDTLDAVALCLTHSVLARQRV